MGGGELTTDCSDDTDGKGDWGFCSDPRNQRNPWFKKAWFGNGVSKERDLTTDRSDDTDETRDLEAGFLRSHLRLDFTAVDGLK